MAWKPLLSGIVQKLVPYKLVTTPLPKKAVVIGAPHTSYFDGLLMVIGLFAANRKFRFLVKDSAVNSPFGPLIRALGGISVDRSSPHGVVKQITDMFAENDEFILVLAPKGTRAQKPYWRSGFYHIARGAKVPVVLGFIDAQYSKRYGWEESMELSGDMRKDMDYIRSFYEETSGIHPERFSLPRLKGEDEL
ncbi:1-acyl-sn-glycerol-3-phosphate acyltransferase [Arcanobacterium urinimassiliense]|uniref:1-acyl-sn-glycerol-3-phosphate acyltransferase n=1 Tax=Arcanobacterium urinimassiliense TaxID=1871014 RepID=UPI00093B2434|nr:1-acyl-sn-glycerol-3-phosphate acyltransferase [Arcanobacterium urinimassiliense]